MKNFFIFFISAIFFQPAFHAAAFESGKRQVTLLELYSSEGCSSCPPADAWVREFRKPSDLWKGYVPVIFHVDYWDNLGWKDPFDSAAYTERQQDYVQSWGGTSLFTPNVVINGKSWNHWRGIKTLPTFNRDAGILKAEKSADGSYRIAFEPEDKANDSYEAHIALLGFDIRSNVKRGENAGRTLDHDFVVLNYRKVPMKSEGAGFFADVQVKTQDERAEKLGLAAWVSTAGSPAPVQATGGYLD